MLRSDRDVKPANILIESGTERVVLANFGLVRNGGKGSRITTVGTLLGTVDYSSSEQARGAAVDPRTDLYSVGVLLYRLLPGQLPFAADTPEAVIYRHVHEAARPARELAPEVPGPVEAMVARLLQKDPADRYQTAAEVLDAIQAYRRGLAGAVAARQPESAKARPAKTTRWRRLHAAAVVSGLFAAALIALAVPTSPRRDADKRMSGRKQWRWPREIRRTARARETHPEANLKRP